jgi:hypothetical protein
MQVTEKISLGFLVVLILGLLAIGSLITQKEDLCENVCRDSKGCKESNPLVGKWYTQVEILCNDGSKLVITQEKNK